MRRLGKKTHTWRFARIQILYFTLIHAAIKHRKNHLKQNRLCVLLQMEASDCVTAFALGMFPWTLCEERMNAVKYVAEMVTSHWNRCHVKNACHPISADKSLMLVDLNVKGLLACYDNPTVQIQIHFWEAKMSKYLEFMVKRMTHNTIL